MTIACTGIGVASGADIAIGLAYRLHRGPVQAAIVQVEATEVAHEIARFRAAVAGASAHLHSIREQIPGATPADIREFIDTHLLMLEDRAIAEAPVELIRHRHYRAESALQVQRDALVQVFEDMDDAYLRTRKDDVDHVVAAIQKRLEADKPVELEQLTGRIVLAEDLTPADIIVLHNQRIAGFVTEFGGPMSHTAILARSLGMPAVVGARGSTACLIDGEPLILDAAEGVVIGGYDAALLETYEQAREAYLYQHLRLLGLRDAPAVTRDRVEITLQANIELPEDVPYALANGALGVGLFRTEFLFMNRQDPPTEDEHYAAYRSVADGLGGRPLTIRTLDLGADKPLACTGLPASFNPALGLRAIRLCLKEPQLFRPQIRAILRVAATAPVRIMLPMLTNVWEALQARALIDDVMRELANQGIPHGTAVPVGGMIEVPAAALAARAFAQHLDFLSIGTNDLVQYTLAIDRVEDEVNYLFDPTHPAVLRLIDLTLRAGREAGIEVSMCGEMAGDTRFTRLLTGLGLRCFSMQSNAIPAVKDVIRQADAAELERRVATLMGQLDAIEAEQLLGELIN
jgi:phosphotransferase system enzyme I (PtsI)